MINAIAHVAGTLGEGMPRVHFAAIENARAGAGAMVIDEQWLARVISLRCSDVACSTASLIGIAAHEFGHLLFGDSLLPAGSESRFQELRADFVAGWVCGRLGIDARHVADIVADLAYDSACGTHPLAMSRVLAIREGLAHAGCELLFALSLRHHVLALEASRDCITGAVPQPAYVYGF